LRAGEHLEKEQNKIARDAAPHAEESHASSAGLMPLGMYPRTGVNRTTFGFQRGGAALDIHTFLRACEFKFVRRERLEGREALVLAFRPHPGAELGDDEKYVAGLSGMVWIDADDRIVTRLVGWPSAGAVGAKESNASGTTKKSNAKVKDKMPAAPALAPGEGPPAVLVEMTRLPEGVWLPREIRLNGLDYPTLFDHIPYSVNFTYGEYKRFNTETKDVHINPPKPL
jgi:hypothetical protein